MANYENFYNGSQYSFEKDTSSGFNIHPYVKDIAYPTDPLTANQLKKVSDKISSGAQTIEVSGLGLSGSGPMKHLASIPKQHWKEIDRLRKLTGVELTFHGPLVESTGYSRGNWSEDQRMEAERQMKAAVELAQQMNSQSETENPKGMVMTFHTNNGLPEVERREKIGTKSDGSPKEVVTQMSVINLRTGQIGNLPTPKQDYFKNLGIEKETMQDTLDAFNKKQWHQQLESIFINNNRARREVVESLTSTKIMSDELSSKYPGGIFEAYKKYNKNYAEYNQEIAKISKSDPQAASRIHSGVSSLNDASFFIEDAYNQLKEAFNEAYERAEKDHLKKEVDKLKKYREELLPLANKFAEDKSNLLDFQEKISEGTSLLKSEKIPPQIYTSLKDFAIDKGSDTFSNVALHAYNNAKENNRAPGIISIENPPAGMSGLTRANELKALIEESRKKFIVKAKAQGMSETQAEKVSKQIIGATWDVGHINSIRKWGYGKEDVIREAKTIAPFVKHMHIADNLGFEDAELPIGMGNVPIEEILDSKQAWTENFRKAKKAIETGDWFSKQGGMGMVGTPIRESLSGLSAPVYSMGTGQSAYWNQSANVTGNYFGGIGAINPDIHHSIYGAGFSGLPSYFGGEMPGKQNSSFSGAPLD